MGVSFLPKSGWIRGGQQLLNTFLATSCPMCERSTAQPICQGCQRQLGQYRLQTNRHQPLPELPVIAWATYEGSVRQIISRLKYDRHPAIAQYLGTELGRIWLQSCGSQPPAGRLRPVVIPIPLHPSRLAQRGFNQAELIAHWFCRVTGLPLLADGLHRVQATTPQHGLSRQQRYANLARAFVVPTARQTILRQHQVWLMDDIFTTGATAQAAAQALRRQRVAVAGLGAVALTPKAPA